MSYFFAPPGPYLGYVADNRLGLSSLWRVEFPVGERREILLRGGQGSIVSSNNTTVVPNDGFLENLSRFDGSRSLRVLGKMPGVSMLEARLNGSLQCSVQLQVGPTSDDSDDITSDEGVTVVLSAIQLAAVLEGASIEAPETSSNRLGGGLQVLGGALELVGAAALLLTPEPTMVTKVLGGTLAVHGSDTVASGLQQLIDGRPRSTLTAQGLTAAAQAMGVNPDDAVKAGMVADIAIPLIAGFAGAARIAAIRRGAISLAAEEAAGGHTIAKHVGRTEAQLRARLATQSRIPAASTFRNLAEAEQAVSLALRLNANTIKTWASTAAVGQRLPLSYDAGKIIIGQGVVRATGQLINMSKMTIVLKKVAQGNKVFFVLTAYPKL